MSLLKVSLLGLALLEELGFECFIVLSSLSLAVLLNHLDLYFFLSLHPVDDILDLLLMLSL